MIVKMLHLLIVYAKLPLIMLFAVNNALYKHLGTSTLIPWQSFHI